MKPILSRFCEIYIYEPTHEGVSINLYQYNLNETFQLKKYKIKRIDWLKKELLKPINANVDAIELSSKLYEKGYNGLDIITLLESNYFTMIQPARQYELLLAFNKVKKDIKSEKLLIYFMLHFLFLGINVSLDNISFM